MIINNPFEGTTKNNNSEHYRDKDNIYLWTDKYAPKDL